MARRNGSAGALEKVASSAREAGLLAGGDQPPSAPRAVEPLPKYQLVAVAELCESVRNPRKRFDPKEQAELVESVRANGVLTPLIVRRHPSKGAGFEIAAGHRRYRAALEAGLTLVPAIVREMDEEQFIKLLNLENLQRSNLDPLEEAGGYSQLLGLPGWDVKRIADAVSKSEKYVYDRIRLLDLIPAAQALLEQGRMTSGHAILIARLAPKDQKRVIDPEATALFEYERVAHDLGESDPRSSSELEGMKPRTVRELDSWIDQHCRFDRSAVDPMVHPETARTLFEAAQAEEPLKVIPITMLHQVPDGARADERTLCRLSWTQADGEPELDSWHRKPKPSKTCEHSVLGVLVVGPGRGETLKVCADKQHCRVHWPQSKAFGAKAAKQRQGAAAWKARQEKENEARDRAAAAWRKLQPRVAALLDQAVSDLRPDSAVLVELAARSARVRFKGKASADGLLRALASQAVEAAIRTFTWSGWRDTDKTARLLKVDLAPLKKEIAAQTSAKKAEKAGPARKKAKGGRS